jgi:hypothetical protein
VVAKARTVTLEADTVATVTVGTYNASRCEVTNLDGAAEVWFTTDGSTPTVGGNDCIALPAVISSVEVAEETAGNVSVKLISAGTPKVQVRVW